MQLLLHQQAIKEEADDKELIINEINQSGNSIQQEGVEVKQLMTKFFSLLDEVEQQRIDRCVNF